VRPSTWPPSPPCRRERGNEAFKAGDFPKALAEYSEAIKRDPDTAVYYVNRAAARTKLLDFSGALADCDKASGGSRQDDGWGWRVVGHPRAVPAFFPARPVRHPLLPLCAA
jgi:tetratricopeptide (TPR) repeat protein